MALHRFLLRLGSADWLIDHCAAPIRVSPQD
jgi:hypothetical protein